MKISNEGILSKIDILLTYVYSLSCFPFIKMLFKYLEPWLKRYNIRKEKYQG